MQTGTRCDFPRRLAADDLTCIIEVSTDLVNWTPDTARTAHINNGNNNATKYWTDNTDNTASNAQFMRVRVMKIVCLKSSSPRGCLGFQKAALPRGMGKKVAQRCKFIAFTTDDAGFDQVTAFFKGQIQLNEMRHVLSSSIFITSALDTPAAAPSTRSTSESARTTEWRRKNGCRNKFSENPAWQTPAFDICSDREMVAIAQW